MNSELTTDSGYQDLLSRIGEVYTSGQLRAHQAVNSVMTETYWQIGHDIVEFEQGGKIRADYGKALLTNLSRDLKLHHGKGFSRSNLSRFRQFYLTYPKCAKASHILSWSHYIELLKLEDPSERSFYEQQAIRENGRFLNFSVRKDPRCFCDSQRAKTKKASFSSPDRG